MADRGVAIVGVSCHLPGGVTDTRKFWDFCAQARCSTRPIPKTRFDASSFSHPDHLRKGYFNVDGGSFLEQDVALFDAPFFNLNEAEATAMDPQHRLLLEAAFLALENAGMDLTSVAGRTDIGVFAAGAHSEYQQRFNLDPYTGSLYAATGGATTMFANRISYFFDIRGPSVTVDTACSSSLTALHQAAESIRRGECNCALVGGAFLQLAPQSMSFMSNLGTLSKDGKSFSFDHRANGYGRGEGAACIILKAADDAIASNDTIRALVRNTAVNHAGRSQGITFPNGKAQSDLVAHVYSSVGLDPYDTVYVEGHGTGTERGDPIEAESIALAFKGNSRSHDGNPLYLGSVKSNFGHLEVLSGLLSVIKCVLMLERKVILPNTNFERNNPGFDFEKSNLKVPTECIPWPHGKVRRTSINNFGFGGSNAHVILEQAPDQIPSLEADPTRPSGVTPNEVPMPCQGSAPNGVQTPPRQVFFTVSAKDEKSLRTNIQSLRTYLGDACDESRQLLLDLSYSLCCRRTRFNCNFATFASTRTQLLENLGKSIRIERTSTLHKICFVFTGQGAQWPQMGEHLMQYPTFAEKFNEAEKYLKEFGAKWSLMGEVFRNAESSSIGNPKISQPAVTALQISLVSLLASWDLVPTTVCGHSSGEIAAAFAAGILDTRSCMALAYYRGKVTSAIRDSSVNPSGAMMAVGVGPLTVEPLLGSLRNGLATVACFNSPNSVTVSGDKSALVELKPKLDRAGIFNRMLKVDVAYHSDHMITPANEYLEAVTPTLKKNLSTPGKVTMFSTVTGTAISPHLVSSPLYWATNLVCPVRFASAVSSMISAYGESHSEMLLSMLEIGPHSALKGPLREILQVHDSVRTNKAPEYFSAMVRYEDARQTVLDLVVSLIARGLTLNTVAIHNETSPSPEARLLVDLPPYSFNKVRRHWHENRLTSSYEQEGSPWSVLLGHKITGSVGSVLQFRNVFSLEDIPWLRDHKVNGIVIFPLAGYISMAIEAIRYSPRQERDAIDGYSLREVTINRALTLLEGAANELFTVLNPQAMTTRASIATGWFSFQILSWKKESGFSEHCKGSISVVKQNHSDMVNETSMSLTKGAWAEQLRWRTENHCKQEVSPDTLYCRATQKGLAYGPAFALLSNLRTGHDCAVGTITCADMSPVMPMQFHPTLKLHPTTFDAILHVSLCNLGGNDGNVDDLRAYIPTFLGEAFISDRVRQNPGDQIQVYMHDIRAENMSRWTSTSGTCFSLEETNPVIEIRDLQSFEVSDETTETSQADVINPLKLDWCDHPDFITSHSLDDWQNPDSIPAHAVAEIWALEQQVFYLFERALSLSASSHTSSRHLVLLRRWMESTVAHVISAHASSQEKEWLELDESARTEFIHNVAARNCYGALNCRVGEQLHAILTEQVDPLSVLNEDNGIWRIYEEFFVFKHCERQVAQLVSYLARQKPSLRILEVGAGIGGFTNEILLALSSLPSFGIQFETYHYTDVSTEFFQTAANKFERWKDMMEYKKLDLSKDPLEQGFFPSTYDLVIAGDVIHATPIVEESLTHIRRLLKPNGVLIMAEPSSFSNLMFTFATLPGWWEREAGACIPEHEWHNLLLRTGFTGVEAAIKDFPEISLHKVYWTHTKSTKASLSQAVTILSGPETSPDHLEDQLHHVLESKVGKRVQHLPSIAVEAKDGIFICLDEIIRPVLSNLDSPYFEAIKNLAAHANGILWVTRAPQAGSIEQPCLEIILGFARTLRHENAGLKFVILQLDATERDLSAASIAKVLDYSFADSQSTGYADQHFREIHGRLQVPRFIPDAALHEFLDFETNEARIEEQDLWQEGRLLQAHMRTIGLFSTFYFQNDSNTAQLVGDDEIIVEIKATGLNFKDVLIALGSLPWQGLGRECSGIVIAVGDKAKDRFRKGDAVVHWGENLFATHVRCNTASVIKMPNRLSFEEAASIPIVYATAYECLVNSARLTKGEKVLIHAAAGGVGQAAIMIAQWIGAEVFCTVGTPEKKDLIMRCYNIPEDHIFSSRSSSFAQALMMTTQMKGVDVILNSLAGDMLRVSWSCLSIFGRFIDIGKRDAVANASLEMAPFDKSVTYSAVDLSLYTQKRPEDVSKLMSQVMELINRMAVRPVQPIQSLSISNFETAMRTMQAGKHMGKIILTNNANARVKARRKPAYTMNLRSDASYVLTGGTGGLGRCLVRFLLESGAKYIILASRSGHETVSSGAMKDLLEEAAANKATVLPIKCDVSLLADVQKMLADVAQRGIPSVRGVIHGAMVLRDALFENSKFDDWQAVLAPKVVGAMNLHTALQDQPLEFFICLSSLVAATGNFGQASYAGSNTFLDAFCRWRGEQGLPAASIGLPAISDVGYLAEGVADGGLRSTSDLQKFSVTGAQSWLLVKSVIRAGFMGFRSNGNHVLAGLSKGKGLKDHPWMQYPLFTLLRHADADRLLDSGMAGAAANGSGTDAVDKAYVNRKALLQVTRLDDAVNIVHDALARKLASDMMISPEDVMPTSTVTEFGLDSLVAVEIRNWIAKELEANVPIIDIIGTGSIKALVMKIVHRSNLLANLRDDQETETDGKNANNHQVNGVSSI